MKCLQCILEKIGGSPKFYFGTAAIDGHWATVGEQINITNTAVHNANDAVTVMAGRATCPEHLRRNIHEGSAFL